MRPAQLYDYVDPTDTESMYQEVMDFMGQFYADCDLSVFERAFLDVERLFAGRYPGYKASNTKYHDFEHTCSVVLAMERLIYGAMADGHSFSCEEVKKGLLASLFHDVGLIQATDDSMGTGAKYTVGHEERSIQFMRESLEGKLGEADIEDIADCIRCTILAMQPSKIAFRDQTTRLMGYFLGSADLLAQIADRCYLEKLLLLFEEFKEAKLPGYATPYDLLSKTSGFYRDVARKRLDHDLEGVSRFMGAYFKSRWQLDTDLYEDAIHSNMDYLARILEGCMDDIECFMRRLRRGKHADVSQ